MAFDRFRNASEESVELNVVPVMNLFMVLIPFLLLGATFFHIGVIPTATPTLSPSESDVPKTPKTVAVNLIIEKDTIKISAASVSLSEEELLDLAGEWQKKDGEYPIMAVQAALIDIKKQYPESNTMTVLPYEELGYQQLVKILDATRNRKIGEDKQGDPIIEDILPVTIFSRFVPVAPEDMERNEPVEGAVPAEEEAAEGGDEGGG